MKASVDLVLEIRESRKDKEIQPRIKDKEDLY